MRTSVAEVIREPKSTSTVWGGDPSYPHHELARVTGDAFRSLSTLTSHVDRISGKEPLRSHPSVRDQMRRSAMDALSHTACAVEALTAGDFRRLLDRTMGALTELETLARIGEKAGALRPQETEQVIGLARESGEVVRTTLGSRPRPMHAL
jgi:hypothetical protein